jgi:DNA repair protein SbcD/Mre11
MKIVHFADTHIGVETYGGIDPATGLSTRVIDELRALDSVIEYALDNHADLVIFCGDVYKNREPSQTHQREFAARIRRLSEAHIPTVIVIGNHDLPGAQGKANSVDIFETLHIDHIHIADRPGVMKIDTPSGLVQVAVFPWLRRNALLSRDETKNLGVGEVMAQMQDVMSARLTALAEEIDPALPAVLASHIAISSAKTGTEKSMMIGNDPVVMLSTIASPVYDYVALGHVHRQQVLSEAPPVVYSGSMERLDFSDEKEEKGFYVADINTGVSPRTVSYTFHPVQARRFLTLKADISEAELDPNGTIMAVINGNKDDVKGAVVRLKLSLPANMSGLVRDNEIFKALKEAYNVSISKEIRHEAKSRASGWLKEGLTPMDALKNYIEGRSISPERQKMLIDYAEKLIEDKLSADRGSYAI